MSAEQPQALSLDGDILACMHAGAWLLMPICVLGLPADFYTPPVAAEALAAIKQLAGVAALPWGGYSQAERVRLILGQEDAVEGLRADPEQVSHTSIKHFFGAHLTMRHTKTAHPKMHWYLHGYLVNVIRGQKGRGSKCVIGIDMVLASCMQADAVAALSMKGNFMWDPATHRDFLGAMLGTGVDRSKVGGGPKALPALGTNQSQRLHQHGSAE